MSNLYSTDKNLESFLINMAELYQWELKNSPLLGSMTGRHLYFEIAQNLFDTNELACKSLQDFCSGSMFSERALRMRMRQLESDQMIEVVAGCKDGRVKSILPTKKFFDDVLTHAQEAKRIFQKAF